MAFRVHRRLAIPMWAVAASVMAVSTLPGVMSSLIALLGIAAVGCTLHTVNRRRTSRPLGEVLPAIDAPPREADDAADLLRMDDEGGGSSRTNDRPADEPNYRVYLEHRPTEVEAHEG